MCPKCGSKSVVEGHTLDVHNRFCPARTKFFSLAKDLNWPRTEAPTACMDCGFVWSSLDPMQLREFMRKYGKK